jgi:hypothetical protein
MDNRKVVNQQSAAAKVLAALQDNLGSASARGGRGSLASAASRRTFGPAGTWSAADYRQVMADRFAVWNEITGADDHGRRLNRRLGQDVSSTSTVHHPESSHRPIRLAQVDSAQRVLVWAISTGQASAWRTTDTFALPWAISSGTAEQCWQANSSTMSTSGAPHSLQKC